MEELKDIKKLNLKSIKFGYVMLGLEKGETDNE